MTYARLLAPLLLGATALSGCATFGKERVASAADARTAIVERSPVPAKLTSEPPLPLVFAIPEPLPLPGQLMPVDRPSRREPRDPTSRVTAANAAARIEPIRDGFVNAVQSYPYTEGALYQVYTAPGHVTDIVLQEGERLAGTGPVAAGDPDCSGIVVRVTAADPNVRMPPGRALAAEEQCAIARWIADGAKR